MKHLSHHPLHSAPSHPNISAWWRLHSGRNLWENEDCLWYPLMLQSSLTISLHKWEVSSIFNSKLKRLYSWSTAQRTGPNHRTKSLTSKVVQEYWGLSWSPTSLSNWEMHAGRKPKGTEATPGPEPRIVT